MKGPFERLNFSQQFLLGSALVLVLGMAIVGTWIGRQIESSAVNRAAAIAAVYVESILSAQMQGWPGKGEMDSEKHAMLDRVFLDGPLLRKVVRFKLWDANGFVLYSNDHAQMGRRFPIEGRLAGAFTGTLQARISDLEEIDNRSERERWSQLLEVYVPMRSSEQGQVIAVAEFYHSTENLFRDIHVAQQRSWVLVAATTVAIYLLLLGMVRRASNTILSQQQDLRQQLHQLRTALEENERMHDRLRDAGMQTTTLNEQFLHRIAADLHDGPAQEIAFALMRFDELVGAYTSRAPYQDKASHELQTIRDALSSSLDNVRNIAAGIGLPGLAELSLAETARSAVRDFERMSGLKIEKEIDKCLDQEKMPLAIRITLYRLLQESLANSWRHAAGSSPRVRVKIENGWVLVEIADQGSGFDPLAAVPPGRLGLAFIRERVRLHGGVFKVDSAPGRGTCVRAQLPLSSESLIHA